MVMALSGNSHACGRHHLRYCRAALATFAAVYIAWRTVAESAVAQVELAPFTPDELRWFEIRNQLASPVGFEDGLPECDQVWYATSDANARNSVHNVEIEGALEALAAENGVDVLRKNPWSRN